MLCLKALGVPGRDHGRRRLRPAQARQGPVLDPAGLRAAGPRPPAGRRPRFPRCPSRRRPRPPGPGGGRPGCRRRCPAGTVAAATRGLPAGGLRDRGRVLRGRLEAQAELGPGVGEGHEGGEGDVQALRGARRTAGSPRRPPRPPRGPRTGAGGRSSSPRGGAPEPRRERDPGVRGAEGQVEARARPGSPSRPRRSAAPAGARRAAPPARGAGSRGRRRRPCPIVGGVLSPAALRASLPPCASSPAPTSTASPARCCCRSARRWTRSSWSTPRT